MSGRNLWGAFSLFVLCLVLSGCPEIQECGEYREEPAGVFLDDVAYKVACLDGYQYLVFYGLDGRPIGVTQRMESSVSRGYAMPMQCWSK